MRQNRLRVSNRRPRQRRTRQQRKDKRPWFEMGFNFVRLMGGANVVQMDASGMPHDISFLKRLFWHLGFA